MYRVDYYSETKLVKDCPEPTEHPDLFSAMGTARAYIKLDKDNFVEIIDHNQTVNGLPGMVMARLYGRKRAK